MANDLRLSLASGPSSIDRSSFVPAYLQVADLLRGQIARGEYPPGSRVPSEPELCELYGVARNTARQAISQLTQEGVLRAERGRGTFVNPTQLSSAIFSLDELRRQLDDPATQVQALETRALRASGRVARKLWKADGSRVLSIRRLLTRGDEPLIYHSEYLVWDPTRPLVEAELTVTALRGLFSGIGQTSIKTGELQLHATALTEGEAERLGEPVGTLAWVIEHTFFDFTDQPVSWGRFVCRSDRMAFKTTVGIARDRPHQEGTPDDDDD
jgi:GntR family transcriptional regulator